MPGLLAHGKAHPSASECGRKIISLDQYVVSNLMKLDNPTLQRTDKLAGDPFWQELRDLLKELRDLQLIIICPDSVSHVSESRISPFNAELEETYEHLSGGITFNSFNEISNSQIGELARAWSEQRDPVFNSDPSDSYPMIRTSGMSGST